jgi:hypothetical protein
MKIFALGLLALAVYIVIRNPHRRDIEVDRMLARSRQIRKLKREAGVPLTFEDLAMSRAERRLD